MKPPPLFRIVKKAKSHYRQFMQNQFSLDTFSIFVKSQCIVLPVEFTFFFHCISFAIKYSIASKIYAIILYYWTTLIALILVHRFEKFDSFEMFEIITKIFIPIYSLIVHSLCACINNYRTRNSGI